MPPSPTPAREPLLTEYYIFETKDGGRTWTYLETQAAPNSEAALRKFSGDPPGKEGRFCAVSRNAWKPRNLKPRILAGISDAEMPGPASDDPVPETTEEPPAS